jgi:hypothetical protein
VIREEIAARNLITRNLIMRRECLGPRADTSL